MSGVWPVDSFLFLEDGAQISLEDDSSPKWLLLEDAVVALLTDTSILKLPIDAILADLHKEEKLNV